MASFTVITVNGNGHLGVTVDESVGAGGRNKFGDVMLVQALLKYILPARYLDLSHPGFELPEIDGVTGIYDESTDIAIDYYQRSRAFNLLKSDGRIDPPSYGYKSGRGSSAKWVQRNLKDLSNPLMTMTLLHFEARKAAKNHHGHGRYTTGLTGMFKQLRPQMKGTEYERMNWLK